MSGTQVKGLVSVIIPVYNREALILETLASVASQTHQEIEIIVVDDGSTDKTVEAVNEFSQTNKFVKLIEQENSGPGSARQRGLEAASGEFIQYLDSDDILLENKFSWQVAALQENSQAVAAYGKTEHIGLAEERRHDPWKLTGVKREFMFPEFLSSRWWGTSTPLYRRDCLDQIGPWLNLINEEDWEYDCRLASLGKPLVFIDEFVSIQRRHNDHLSSQGAYDPRKLADRALARRFIYNAAVNSKTPIPTSYFDHFSKASFLLARECAAQNLSDASIDLINLSIRAGSHSPYKQRMFVFFARIFGWRAAARVAAMIDKAINA